MVTEAHVEMTLTPAERVIRIKKKLAKKAIIITGARGNG